MALAWKAGWVNALRGSNPLSSATSSPALSGAEHRSVLSGGLRTGVGRLGSRAVPVEVFPACTGSGVVDVRALDVQRGRMAVAVVVFGSAAGAAAGGGGERAGARRAGGTAPGSLGSGGGGGELRARQP